MNETFSAMKERIETFCIHADRTLSALPPQDDSRRETELRALLDGIVAEFGVCDYAFSYVCAWFSETHAVAFSRELERIFREDCRTDVPVGEGTAPDPARSRSFTAFYLLVSCLVHRKETDAARKLLEDDSCDCRTAFRDMPLFYDLVSRCDKRSGERIDARTALLDERKAIDMLERRSCRNVGVSCSFASTVSLMLERGLRVPVQDEEKAAELIDGAIEYNPEYAKYYFIRARLRFHSGLSPRTGKERLNLLYTARDDCERAVIRESSHRKDYRLRVEDYKRLLEKIENEIGPLEDALAASGPDAGPDLRPEVLDALREEVLAAENEAELVRYPPAETFGEKYVFICYSRADFRRVYCDMIELARRRIPFLYDHGTVLPGYDWDVAVAERIRDPRCAGIVFYLGGSSVLSSPLAKEILLVRAKSEQLGKHANSLFFTVNLTGEVPSRMLVRAIRNCGEDDSRISNLTSERIVQFLSTFTDAGDFIRRSPDAGDVRHMEAVVRTVARKFGIQPVPGGRR